MIPNSMKSKRESLSAISQAKLKHLMVKNKETEI